MEKNPLVQILLWLIFITHISNTIISANSPDIFERQIELPNSEIITIGELYGMAFRNIAFNPGSKFLNFLRRNRGSIPKMDVYKIKNTETESAIMKTHIEEFCRDNGKKNFIIILGDPQTGKTTALKIMEKYYHEHHLTDFTIFVDLPKVILSKSDVITIDDILKSSINDDFTGFIRNVAEINPQKIRFLFDGVDQVPYNPEILLSFISTLQKRNINIVMTSGTDLRSKFVVEKTLPTLFEVESSISNSIILKFTTQYWTEAMKLRGEHLSEELIDEYSKIFRMMIQETPLPRTFSIVRKLAQRFLNRDLVKPYLDVLTYSKKGDRYYDPIDIIKDADEINFSKMQFYDNFFKPLNPMIEVYGPYALRIKFQFHPASEIIRLEIENEIVEAEKILNQYGSNKFPFLKFRNGKPIDFYHRDYKRYFAAKYLIKSFETDKPLTNTFKTILINPKYAFILEFVNSEFKNIDSNSVGKIKSLLIQLDFIDYIKVIDNLMEHKFDYFCSKMFEFMDEKKMFFYLDQASRLKSKNKYSFGMLADPDNSHAIHYVPRKTRWMYRGTRTEMIVNMEMKETKAVLTSKGYKLDPSIYLPYYARKSEESLEDFLNSHQGESFSNEVLEKAMYESLAALGEDSLGIIERLQKLGGVPSNVRVNGQTLLHVGVPWHSQYVVDALTDYFKVLSVDTPDHFGRSVLFTALDSNPFPTHTPAKFWETMYYLLKRVDVSSNKDRIIKSYLKYSQYTVNPGKLPRIFQVLMIGGSNEEHRNAVDIVERYVPLRDFDVPMDVLATRRSLAIKYCLKEVSNNDRGDSITITDILLKFRGIDDLRTEPLYSYEDTIRYSLIKEASHFNLAQRQRVFKGITKNIVMQSELDRTIWSFGAEVLPKLKVPWAHEVYEIYRRRLVRRISAERMDDSIEKMIVITRSDLQPEIQADVGLVLHDVLFSKDDGYNSWSDSSPCDF